MDQPTLEEIQKRYLELLKKSQEIIDKDNPPETKLFSETEVMSFLETLARAGLYIDDPDSRALLREQIRYWVSFVNEKTGSYPVFNLQPFTTEQVKQPAEQTTQQVTEEASERIKQATQQVTEADGATAQGKQEQV